MARLSLALLGGLRVRLEPGPPPRFHTKKAQALLAYLALSAGRSHRRDKLAALLWGSVPDEQARNSLRHALYELRKAVAPAAPAPLLIESDTVGLEPSAVDVDVTTFTRLVGDATPEALERAVTLYEGDLLEGFRLKEEAFESWLTEERELLREVARRALAKLLSHQSTTGALEAATRTGHRLLALDPLQEAVHRTLMHLHARLGHRGAALRQYQDCVNVLQRELGVEPEADTKRLYQELLRQRTSSDVARIAPHTPSAAARAVGAGASTRPSATPLVGRAAEIAQLRQALDRAEAGSGGAFVILGEAGIGKSRVVEELIAHAVGQGRRVLLGRAYESDQVLLFGPLVDALRHADLERDRDVFDGLGPVWRAELSRLLPEIAEPGTRALSDRVDYRRLFECLAQVMLRLAARDSLLLVLEDVHWADEMTVRFLAFLTRRVQAERVLMVVTARADELTDAPLLRHTLEDLGGARQLASLRLAPLSRSDTVTLVRMLARTSTRAMVERLGEQVWAVSEGHPFMVVETMRNVQETSGSSDDVALPPRVREVIGRRLERLGDASRSLLTVAAVIGREFEFELLRHAAGLDEATAAEVVEELVRRHVLTGVGERLDFTHDRIREVAYAALPSWRRKGLHGRIAQAIETVYRDRVSDFWEVLADHFDRGEAWTRSARYRLDVAERAKHRYAYATAERACRRALESLANASGAGGDRTRALTLLGDVLSLRGDLDDANASYQAALDATPGGTERRGIASKLHRPRVASRDDARLAYYEHGRGDETLLLMNPIIYGLEIFQPMLEQLCQEFRILTMDPRGTGRSDPISAGFGTAAHAADVRAVIEAAGGEPVTAIGISKSGNILVRLAVSSPRLVKRLVLVGTPLDITPGSMSLVPSALDDRFREALRAGDIERAMACFVATIVTDPDTDELAEQFTRNLLRLPRATIASNWSPDPEVDIAPVLQQVTCPTLVMHGTRDRRVSLAAARHLAAHIPGAQLYLFEGRGHLPIFTATTEFCEVVRRFITTGEARPEDTAPR